MGFKDFMASMDKKEATIEEEIEKWKNMTSAERAAMIEEVKENGTEEEKAHLLEVAEMSKANAQAGGTGTQTGDEILSKKEGTGDSEWSDENPQLSDKGKLASAAGIGAGLGALNMAKKLRRSQKNTGDE